MGFMGFFYGIWERILGECELSAEGVFSGPSKRMDCATFFFYLKKNEYIYYFPRFSSSSSLFYVHTHTLNVGAFTFLFPFDFRQQQRIKSNRNR